MTFELTRRRFMQSSGATLALAFTFGVPRAMPSAAARETATPVPDEVSEAFAPNAWLSIEQNGDIIIALSKSEMGQGVMTALPAIVAEELDADWARVRVVPAYGDPAYGSFGGNQFTFGSTSVSMNWDILRYAGATARAMLIEAAASRWGVPPAACRTALSEVIHDETGRRLPYGELALDAATLPVPSEVMLKDRAAFTIIGQPLPRLDIPAKSDGSALFGIDVAVPGMLTAVTLRPPVYGATLLSFDASITMMIPGVQAVVEIPSVLPGVDTALAIVADGFWPAMKGREALRVEWEGGRTAGLDSALIHDRMVEALDAPAPLAFASGDIDAAFAAATTTVETEYEAPYLAHGSIEPLNCTADVRADRVDVWVGTQGQTATLHIAAQIADVPVERVTLHECFLGGGFGRRAEVDYVADAVTVSRAMGAPVKVIWPREEDMRHDFFRPASLHRVRVALDEAGAPTAWEHRVAGEWIAGERFPMFLIAGPEGETYDPNSVAALTGDFFYPIASRRIETTNITTGMPIGFWRGVGHSTNCWIIESVIDEAAIAAGQDPLAYRRALLSANPRAVAVLDAAAAASGWDTPLRSTAGSRSGRGVAVLAYPSTLLAAVVEVTANDDGKFTIDRVVIAADCGIVVNPTILAQQLEGGVLFGISAALYGEITVADGGAVQTGFDTYPLLRFPEAPAVETVIVPSDAAPGGMGEPPTVVAIPALTNAIAAATGVRPRRLPLRPAPA